MPWSHLCILKVASYEQNKTNLGNQNFRRRIITVIVPRIMQHQRGYPRYRHVGDTTVDRTDFTWQNFEPLEFLSTFQKASRRPRKGPIANMYCHVDAVFATS